MASSPDVTTSFVEWVTAALVGIGGVVLGLRKLRVGWGADSVQIVSQQAQQAIITQLHEELVRMHAQNEVLGTAVDQLQQRTLDLSAQINLLTGENQALRGEIESLRGEVAHMRAERGAARP